MRFISKKSEASPSEEELCARVLCAAVTAAQLHHPHIHSSGNDGGGDKQHDLDAMCGAFNALVRSRLQPRCSRFPHDHHDTCMYIERSKNANLVVYTAQLHDVSSGERVESGAGRACVLHSSNPLHAYWVTLHPDHLQARRARGDAEVLGELTFIQRKLAYGCHTSCLARDKFVSLAQSKKAHKALEAVPALPTDTKGECGSGSGSGSSSSGSAGGAVTAGCHSAGVVAVTAAALTREVCEHWHAAFAPHLVTFVALPTWPLLLLTLPPLTTTAATQGADNNNNDPQQQAIFPAPASTVCALLTSMHGEVCVLDKIYVKSIEPEHVYQLPSVEYIEIYGTSLRTGEPVYVKKVH